MFKNRVFTYFAAATPGLRELVTIGKVWELAQLDRRVKKGSKYDVVIVDAPATGHGLGILRTPKTFGDIARVGPDQAPGGRDLRVHHRPEADRRSARSPGRRRCRSTRRSTCSATCKHGARPEARPGLHERHLPGPVQRRRGGDAPASASSATAARTDGDRAVVRRAALRAAISEHRRANAHREQLERLAKGLRQDVVELPFLFRPQLDMSAVERARRPIEEGSDAVNVGDLLEGKEICICAGSGGVGKTTTSAAVAMGMAAPRQEGRGADDRPGEAARQLARAARARQRGDARRARARSPSTGIEMKGELWAMMLDAKRTFDDLVERHAPDEETRDRILAEPDLPGDLERDGRLAGVHGDGEALRAPPGGALRPARARHAADPPRARLHRRARADDAASSRASRCSSS